MTDSVVEFAHSKRHIDWMPWFVCLSAGLFFFYEFFQLNLFDVINRPLRDEFHLNAQTLSWMSSMYLWADLIFLIPAGMILDRYSTRHVIIMAMLVCLIGTIGFAFTHSFIMASFFHFLSGIGNAFCFLSCVVLIARWFPPRQQALVIGCVVTMAFLGGMAAHAPFAYMNAHLGWRQSMLIDGGIGVLILFWIMAIVRDEPENSKHMSSKAECAGSPNFLQVLKQTQNWLGGFYTCCMNLPIMVLGALWGASYLQVTYHVSPMDASHIVSFIFFGSIVGCPVFGWISDASARRKPLMVIGAAGTMLTLLPLWMHITLSQQQLVVIFCLLGVFTSSQVLSYPFIAESNRHNNIGSATGMASVIIMGGAGVAQVLFGQLLEHHAIQQPYTGADFQYAMWLFPIATLLALLASFLMRETYCKPMA